MSFNATESLSAAPCLALTKRECNALKCYKMAVKLNLFSSTDECDKCKMTSAASTLNLPAAPAADEDDVSRTDSTSEEIASEETTSDLQDTMLTRSSEETNHFEGRPRDSMHLRSKFPDGGAIFIVRQKQPFNCNGASLEVPQPSAGATVAAGKRSFRAGKSLDGTMENLEKFLVCVEDDITKLFEHNALQFEAFQSQTVIDKKQTWPWSQDQEGRERASLVARVLANQYLDVGMLQLDDCTLTESDQLYANQQKLKEIVQDIKNRISAFTRVLTEYIKLMEDEPRNTPFGGPNFEKLEKWAKKFNKYASKCFESDRDCSRMNELCDFFQERVTAYLNKFWALLDTGSSIQIIRTYVDEKKEVRFKRGFNRVTFTDCYDPWKAPQLHVVKKNSRGKKNGGQDVTLETKQRRWTDIWLNHKNRLLYRDEIFNPGATPFQHGFIPNVPAFNLWRGIDMGWERATKECMEKNLFLDSDDQIESDDQLKGNIIMPQMKLKEEIIKPFLDHIKNIWCKGDVKSYEYVLNWFAHILQHPEKKAETVLVLVGAEGAGKSCIFNMIGKIIGKYSYVSVDNIDSITGQFNSAVASRILIFLDECTFAKNHPQSARLKNLVTADTVQLNRKFQDYIVVDNYCTVGISTNNVFAIMVDPRSRRQLCLEVDEKYSGPQTAESKTYFDALNSVPLCAIAHYLYSRDLSCVNLRDIPITSLKSDQQERTLAQENPLIYWWLNVLTKRCIHVGLPPFTDYESSNFTAGKDKECPSRVAARAYNFNHSRQPKIGSDGWCLCSSGPIPKTALFQCFQDSTYNRRNTNNDIVTERAFWAKLKPFLGPEIDKSVSKPRVKGPDGKSLEKRVLVISKMPLLSNLRKAFGIYMNNPNWDFGPELQSELWVGDTGSADVMDEYFDKDDHANHKTRKENDEFEPGAKILPNEFVKTFLNQNGKRPRPPSEGNDLMHDLDRESESDSDDSQPNGLANDRNQSISESGFMFMSTDDDSEHDNLENSNAMV